MRQPRNCTNSDMSCSKCSVALAVGTPYYQWSCGHLLTENCFGPQIYTEVGLKCPVCSSMMTRRMYEQWCLRGFVQHYLSRSGFKFPALSTAPILAQYTSYAPLMDLSRFAPVQPFQLMDTAVQCTGAEKIPKTKTPRQFYSQYCKKKPLAKKD